MAPQNQIIYYKANSIELVYDVENFVDVSEFIAVESDTGL